MTPYTEKAYFASRVPTSAAPPCVALRPLASPWNAPARASNRETKGREQFESYARPSVRCSDSPTRTRPRPGGTAERYISLTLQHLSSRKPSSLLLEHSLRLPPAGPVQLPPVPSCERGAFRAAVAAAGFRQKSACDREERLGATEGCYLRARNLLHVRSRGSRLPPLRKRHPDEVSTAKA